MPQPAQRSLLQPCVCKVGVALAQHIVKAGDLMMELSADGANQPVSKRRHLAEQQDGAELPLVVRLRNGGEEEVTLPHNPGLAP